MKKRVLVIGSAAVLLQLSRQTAIPIFRNPQFWIAAGAMLYFSFTVLVFVIYETIANNNYLLSLYQPVWAVHLIMNILSNLLYSIAFICPSNPSRFRSRK